MTVLARAKLLRCERVGRAPVVRGRVWVHGGGSVVLGDRVRIDGRAAPVELHAHRGARIRIGDGVGIGPGASVEALGEVTVADGAELGSFCKVLDSHFHPRRGDRNRLVPPVPVRIDAGAVIGPRAIVLPGAHVAAGARVPPGAVISRRGPRDPGDVGREWPGLVPRREAWLDALAYRASLALQLALAWGQLRGAAFGRRVFASGRVRLSNQGTLEIEERVQFLGGMIPTRIDCRRGARLHVGAGTLFNYGAIIEATESVHIGRRCRMASFVRISDRDEARSRPIRIGDDVWIAHGATVCPGVSIGDRSVVAAGAVVTTDVPPDSLAVGNPARAVPLGLVDAAG